uniref:Fibronectin type-III domain-containing protein n=1 Tax=Amphora coffeiformis TaxID=265554 RepID=A0A7S3KY77_9STRA
MFSFPFRNEFAVLVFIAVLSTTNIITLAQSTDNAELAAATYPPLFTDPNREPVYSRLWGQNGERFDQEAAALDPENVLLRDHTDVGYALGNAPIPSDDWPIWKELPELGGIPNDGRSDVAALRAAIEQCPPNHVIYLPAGRYIIDEQIIWTADYSNITIRGESRDSTILFFPKHSREIKQVNTDISPMIDISGGEHRGIEDLSMVFRNEQKGTGYYPEHTTDDGQRQVHWFYVGEFAVAFQDNAKNSWLRNLYIKNANHAIMVQGKSTQISVFDIVLDQYFGRTAAGDRDDGHMGIKVGETASRVLVHNILVTGDWVHDIVVMGTHWSVFSRILSQTTMKLDHHAGGNRYLLYTEIDVGIGGQSWGGEQNNLQETYWGISSVKPDEYLPTSRKCTFVGMHTEEPTSIGATWHHENLDPLALSPANMYLTQMARKPEKYLPPYRDLLPLPKPPAVFDGVFQILPSDDIETSRPERPIMNIKGGLREGFAKFDFSQTPGLAGATKVANAHLRFYVSDLLYDFFVLSIYKVANDTWDEETLVWQTKPEAGAMLYNTTVYTEQFPMEFDVDITEWVNENLAQGDEQISVTFQGRYRGMEQLLIRTKEDRANPIHLNVVLDEDMVDPPAPPTGLTAEAGYYWIHLDWDDNTEFDLASYTVYKHREGSDEIPAREAMGLVASAYTDFALLEGETYTYTVTSVDFANMESVVSETVVATLCKSCNQTAQPPLKRTYPLGIFSTTGESIKGPVDKGDDDDTIVCILSYRDSNSCQKDNRCVWSAGFCWDSYTGTYSYVSAATSTSTKVGTILSVVLTLLSCLS